MNVRELSEVLGVPEARDQDAFYIKDVSRWAKWEEDWHEDILEEGCLLDLANSEYADCEVAFVDYQWNVNKYAIVIES